MQINIILGDLHPALFLASDKMCQKVRVICHFETTDGDGRKKGGRKGNIQQTTHTKHLHPIWHIQISGTSRWVSCLRSKRDETGGVTEANAESRTQMDWNIIWGDVIYPSICLACSRFWTRDKEQVNHTNDSHGDFPSSSDSNFITVIIIVYWATCWRLT